MKKLILASVAASALMLSTNASAQQAEKEAQSFISEQVASVSVELFNMTKATVIETLTSWSDDLLTDSSENAASKEVSKTSADQPTKPESK